jgi:hypothetical protein
MEYTGKMKFVNSSMMESISGTVTHIACTYPYDTGDPSDYYSKDTLTFTNIADSGGDKSTVESGTAAISTESSKYDLWLVDAKWHDSLAGDQEFKYTFECGFEGVDDGGTVQIIMDGPSGEVTVKFPSALSSNCSKSWAW